MSVLGPGLLSPVAVHALKSPPAQGSSRSTSLVVPTASGKVKGQAQTGYDAWLGIPYAAAPVLHRASTWGSVLPAVWSFMLAARARARGLGTDFRPARRIPRGEVLHRDEW
ncbi:hypothetical protein [Streptomyces sp. NPDC001100]